MFKEYYGQDKVGMGVGFQFFWKVKHTKQKYSDIHSYWNQYKCHTLIVSILSFRFWSILTVLFREWLYPLLLCLVWLAMFSPSSFCAPLGLTWRFDFLIFFHVFVFANTNIPYLVWLIMISSSLFFDPPALTWRFYLSAYSRILN